jgi:hypothetical protein
MPASPAIPPPPPAPPTIDAAAANLSEDNLLRQRQGRMADILTRQSATPGMSATRMLTG